MQLHSPEWLLLTLPLLALGYLRPQLKLWQPLRAGCMLLPLLALCGPQIVRHDDSLDLWVLADRSASINDYVAKHLPEWESILRRSKRAKDNLNFVEFADVATVRGEGDASYFDTARNQTRISLAIKYALARRDPRRNSRLLLLSDGYSTEPLEGLAESLLQAKVPLDYRLISRAGEQDFRVSEFRAPSRVQSHEPFLLETLVQGSADGIVKLEIRRNDELVQSRDLTIVNGYGVERYVDTVEDSAGAVRYSARVLGPNDAQAGNNSQDLWVEPLGRQRLLLISGFAADPLAGELERQGFAVQTIATNAPKSSSLLVNAQAVLLNNIGAASLSQEFLSALKFYVEDQGGGLIMIGGEQSFGSGGYFSSPIDPLLPVSLELRDEHRKNRSAIAIILDRSGSMAAGVGGGMGSMTKMDLANEGAAKAADIMGPEDELAVVAVDSTPHVVLPIAKLGTDRGQALSLIRSVNSTGGGIFTYVGLRAGWEELKRAQAHQKHIILFADANDSEEPDDYINLLKEVTKQGASASVIGLGTERDSDAALLKDIAQRGNGRCFFVDNAMDLPAVFSQEAVTVSRSTFVKEETKLASSPSWGEIAPGELSWPAAVGGYNLTYARPGSNIPAFTLDSYKAPLVAFWQHGQGKTAVITFPINGNYSAQSRAWEGLPVLISTLVRYVARQQLPPGLFVRNQLIGSALRTELYFDQRWEAEVSRHYPKLKLIAEGSESEERLWSRLAPGHLSATVELPGGTLMRGSVQIGEYSLPFGPLVADSGIEWRQHAGARQQLLEAAKLSGGGERLDLTKEWEIPNQAVPVDLRLYLLTLLLILFLLEVLFSRLHINLAAPIGFPRWIKLPAFKQQRRVIDTPANVPTPKAVDQHTPTAATEAQAATERQNRFSRAKRRGL